MSGNHSGGMINAGNDRVTTNATNLGWIAPTINSCGSGSVVAGCNDFAGSITFSGSVSTCSINFSTKQSVQSCTAMSTASTIMSLVAISNSGVTFGLSPAQASGTLFYQCSTF